jgi:hypothetical protein
MVRPPGTPHTIDTATSALGSASNRVETTPYPEGIIDFHDFTCV